MSDGLPRVASRGPIPRVRGGELAARRAVRVVPQPGLGLEGEVHPLVLDAWEAAGASPQSQLYEATDWQLLRMTLFQINQQFLSGRPSAQMMQVLYSNLGSLMFSEGDRRRLRVEAEKSEASSEQVDVAAVILQRMNGGK